MPEKTELTVEDLYDWADELVDKAYELISTMGAHDSQTEKWKQREGVFLHEYGKYIKATADA